MLIYRKFYFFYTKTKYVFDMQLQKKFSKIVRLDVAYIGAKKVTLTLLFTFIVYSKAISSEILIFLTKYQITKF